MSQPAAASQETALPASLPGVPDGFGRRGRVNPRLGFFLRWGSVLAIPLRWQPLVGALSFPGPRAKPSRTPVSVKASKTGVFQHFLCPGRDGKPFAFFPGTRQRFGNGLISQRAHEMLWLITGWDEVQSSGLTPSGHISLQTRLLPLAQAPPDDFREKNQTRISGVSLVACWVFFLPAGEARGGGGTCGRQMGRGHRVPRQLPLGCSRHQLLFPQQRRTWPPENAPRDVVFLLRGWEGQGAAARSALGFGCVTNEGNIWGQWREAALAGAVRPVSVVQAGLGGCSRIGSGKQRGLSRGRGGMSPVGDRAGPAEHRWMLHPEFSLLVVGSQSPPPQRANFP